MDLGSATGSEADAFKRNSVSVATCGLIVLDETPRDSVRPQQWLDGIGASSPQLSESLHRFK
jgi:hypothetical protein